MSRTESRKGKSAYFVPTISISLVLIVVGMLVFILLNARAVSDHVKRNIGFAVIVKDNTNEAAKSFKKEMGEDFERILGANPLLPSIEIKLNPAYANNDSLVMIEKGLARFDIIHEVYYQKSMIESINENIRRITIIFLIVGAVLVLISFTLIRNMIHLAVYSQRLLIKTMQLVGATPFFICKPFVYGSMWRGFFGALIANLVLLGAIFFVQENVGNVINIMRQDVILLMVGFVILSGVVLSFFSAWFSVRRYLRRDLNDLYV